MVLGASTNWPRSSRGSRFAEAGVPDRDEVSIASPRPSHDEADFETSVTWLFGGPSAMQVDVDKSAFDAKRLAVIRGRALDTSNVPLPGVRVGLLKKKEFGHTFSRSDGGFDLAFDGCDVVTLEFGAEGKLPVPQTVSKRWSAFHFASDVVTVPLDSMTTPIAFPTSGLQVASSTLGSDKSGSRRARVFFPAGTSAAMTLPGGMRARLSVGTFRATERQGLLPECLPV
jgi:hypothetical protein